MIDLSKPLVMTMIQPAPLPGSYRHREKKIGDIIEEVLKEVAIVSDLGFDGVVLQNMNDMPVKQYSRPEAIAYMTAIGLEIKRNFPKLVLGMLVNWDGVASLAAADAAGADFVRVEHLYTRAEVTSAGILQSQCCEMLEMKKRMNSQMPIFADIYEAHAVPMCPMSVEDAAWEAVNEAFADGLFIGGRNDEERIALCKAVKKRVNVPCLLSGGATAENVERLLSVYDGVSVATWIKGGDMKNPIDPFRAKQFLDNARKAKKELEGNT